MSIKNLFFHDGEKTLGKSQIVLNEEKNVTLYENGSDLLIENIKSIEIKPIEGDKIKIKIGPDIIFRTKNKKIVVNDNGDDVSIEIIGTDERFKAYSDMIHAQESKGIIDYISENAPNLFTREKLEQQPLSELKQIKEKLDDLANCY